VLSAEVLPKLVNLGKIYTGDSAQDAPLRDVFSLAEVLAPGISIRPRIRSSPTTSRSLR